MPPHSEPGGPHSCTETADADVRDLPTEQVAIRTIRSSSRLAPELGGLPKALRKHRVLSSLLVFVPVAFMATLLSWPTWAVFVYNAIAIVPLAWLISKATEDLASYLGVILGGLLNATFGNMVELILCVVGIRQGQITVVQCTVVGSILSNMLLILGTAFLWGGYFRPTLVFTEGGGNVHTSLMLLSVMAMVLPTLYAVLMPQGQALVSISRCCAALLLAMYVQYLIFQLRTHAHLFASSRHDKGSGGRVADKADMVAVPTQGGEEAAEEAEGEKEEEEALSSDADDDGDQDRDGEADMTKRTAALVLVGATILTAVCSQFLISAIEGAMRSWKVSNEFFGIVLLPLVGNAAQHYATISVARRNKLDLSLSIAVGSSCQMAMLVTPFMVLFGWVSRVDVTLDFHPFQVTVLFLAVMLVANILKDGTSNWLEGAMLTTAYCIIAFCYYWEQSASDDGDGPLAKDPVLDWH